jgi:AbrB family looped-hinge helix DNA binding protein
MPTLTLSPNFQIVIPKEFRESLALQPGQKIQAILMDGHIQLVPVIPARKLRGFLPGLKSSVRREGDRL